MTKRKDSNGKSLLSRILDDGSEILGKDPLFLDKRTFEGHYQIGAVDYKKSHGPNLFTLQGKRYYDATAYWKTNLIDYKNYKELDDIFEHLGRLSIDAPTMSEMNTTEQAAFTKMLSGFWPSARHIFTHPSGALSVNDACWTAAAIVSEKNGLTPQEMKGVSFTGAFHGRHDRGADATNTSKKVAFRQYNERIIRCSPPLVVFDSLGNELEKESKVIFDSSMKEIESAFKDKKVAYIITEYPFLAEGGAGILQKNALEKIHSLCLEYGKLLIVDCVQMGGRSWTMSKNNEAIPFPSEALEFADIITFGKVFRLSGFMAKDPLLLKRGYKTDVMDEHPYRYGSTWVGRLDQALSGLAIMQTILNHNLWEKGLSSSEVILKHLKLLAKEGVILSPRSRKDTAYVGWDFENSEIRNNFTKIMREQFRILILPAGEKSIRWAPFLDASEQEIRNILNAIDETCRELRVKD